MRWVLTCNKHFQRMLPLLSPQHPQPATAKPSLFRSDIWAGWQKEREHTSHWSLSLSNTKAKGRYPKGQLQVRAVTLPSSTDTGAKFPVHSAEISLWPTKEKPPRWDLSSNLKEVLPDIPCSSPLSQCFSQRRKSRMKPHILQPHQGLHG